MSKVIENTFMPERGGFQPLVGDTVIVASKTGAFKQVPLFRRGDALFVECSGFLRMRPGGYLSHANWRWIEIISDREMRFRQYGIYLTD